MIKPLFPLIAIVNDKGLELISAESFFSKVATLALVDKSFFKRVVLFDQNGDKWRYEQVSNKFQNNLLTRILAKTFYNPMLEAKVIWTKDSNYQLSDLKNSLKHCLDKDDDIITQYEEAIVIKSAIDKSNSFAALVTVLNKYVFAVNEEELWKEHGQTTK